MLQLNEYSGTEKITILGFSANPEFAQVGDRIWTFEGNTQNSYSQIIDSVPFIVWPTKLKVTATVKNYLN